MKPLSFQCKKCLSKEVQVRHSDITEARDIPGGGRTLEKPERLILKCKRCDYNWAEKPADQRDGDGYDTGK